MKMSEAERIAAILKAILYLTTVDDHTDFYGIQEICRISKVHYTWVGRYLSTPKAMDDISNLLGRNDEQERPHYENGTLYV